MSGNIFLLQFFQTFRLRTYSELSVELVVEHGPHPVSVPGDGDLVLQGVHDAQGENPVQVFRHFLEFVKLH